MDGWDVDWVDACAVHHRVSHWVSHWVDNRVGCCMVSEMIGWLDRRVGATDGGRHILADCWVMNWDRVVDRDRDMVDRRCMVVNGKVVGSMVGVVVVG